MTTLARTEFSRRLIALREQHDPPLNQQEAADLVGLSLRQYGRLERREADATLGTIRKIADAYRVQPHLLTGADDDRLTATRQAPTIADLARLEAKLDLLLDRVEALSPSEAISAAPDLAELLHDSRDPALARRAGLRRPASARR